MKTRVYKVSDGLGDFKKKIAQVAGMEVYVGVPEETSGRNDKAPTDMNNAALAHVHEKGDVASGIPARPFLEPGIDRAKKKITARQKAALQTLLNGESPQSHLEAAGQVAVNSVRNVFVDNNWPQIKRSSAIARLRRQNPDKYTGIGKDEKGKKKAHRATMRRMAKLARDAEKKNVPAYRPLIDSGQLRRAITFQVKEG